MKKLTKNLIVFILTLAMLVGTMSTISYAATSDEGDIISVTNGKTFTLRKEYYELLISHPLYGTKDYIIYPWEGNLFVWFFNDDLTDVKFSMWNRGTHNFGLYPSKNVSFTEYVYNKETLEFVQSRNRTINTSNAYNYSYDFMASFNIYTDKTYSTYFYETLDPFIPEAPVENDDIENVTNGKTFSLKKEYYELLTSHSLYGTKDYIIYPWESNLFVWFFNDDLTDVKFSMWNRGTNNFGLYPSKNVSFTEYVYNKETLEFIQSRNRTINTSNAYNYSYDFMASFNIYTDKTYSSYFYEVKDSEENDNETMVTFEPLQPDDAKDFLRFIANAGMLVNMENELPEYYNFLTGKIQDPEEELRIKVSFLTYLYYCLDAQLAQSNERIDMGTTYLINWIGANNDTSNIIYSEIKGSLVDHLKDTIAEGKSIPTMQITGINIATAIMDYGDVFIVSLGSFKAIRTRDEIRYLMAYKELLEAIASNDEIEIKIAESNCSILVNNMAAGGDIVQMKKFATYLFNIEQSL